MSSQAVEARSLSSLTALASNPPSYPRNPTHVRHDPLVLYIARVPGSKDVFLSPMKPRDRVVTAEDVQSSLYYIHVDHPEDARLITPLPEPGSVDDRPASANRPPVPPVPRKAVPTSLAPPGVPAAPKRKPIPETLAPRNDVDNSHNINAASYNRSSPRMLPYDYDRVDPLDSAPYLSEQYRPPLPPRRPTEPSSSIGTSLTIIRRDPASSAQWNVAHVEDSPVPDISSLTANDSSVKKKTGAPLYIEVTNPGYSKFLHNSEQPHHVSRTSDLQVKSQLSINPSSLSPARAPFSLGPSSSLPGETNGTDNVFRRRLWMEGSRYGNAGFGHRKINSHDSNMSRQSPRSSSEVLHRERFSMDLRPPGAPSPLLRDDQSYSTIQVSEKQSSFRGYVFMSPWNGRCEFSTGAGGGSLKCRHAIPGLQGAPPMAMSVSELRFNLPSSTKSSTPMGEEQFKRSSFFHRPRNNRNTSSVSEMDLSLGQEFAGGGAGGRQAKLGKLIIEDEGLKMLDLLVAANIALWWRAYEKVDGRSRNDRGSV